MTPEEVRAKVAATLAMVRRICPDVDPAIIAEVERIWNEPFGRVA